LALKKIDGQKLERLTFSGRRELSQPESSRLSFEENQMSMGRFDFGKHRSTLEQKIAISQPRAFLKAGLPNRGLRVVSRTFGHAALEAPIAGHVSTDAKESARDALSGELAARSHGNREEIDSVARRKSGPL
jgi:hypothetical protein